MYGEVKDTVIDVDSLFVLPSPAEQATGAQVSKTSKLSVELK